MYENFAQKTLGVDESLATPLPKPFKLEGDMFWLEFNVDYVGKYMWSIGLLCIEFSLLHVLCNAIFTSFLLTGKSMEALLETWKREAWTAFTVRSQGMVLELYKVVAQRKVCKITNTNIR